MLASALIRSSKLFPRSAYSAASYLVRRSFAAEAVKAKYERTKPHANVGTIGHVDHGIVVILMRSDYDRKNHAYCSDHQVYVF